MIAKHPLRALFLVVFFTHVVCSNVVLSQTQEPITQQEGGTDVSISPDETLINESDGGGTPPLEFLDTSIQQNASGSNASGTYQTGMVSSGNETSSLMISLDAEQGSGDATTGDVMSGSLLTGSTESGAISSGQTFQLPKLFLSEVFFDGSDEFFEVTNRGESSFSGTLVVSGVKNSSLILSNITIGPGQSRVYGDQMTQITNPSIVGWSNLGLTISDTQALQVQLYRSGNLVDQFAVDTSVINQLNNKDQSLEKLTPSSSPVSTLSGRTLNVTGSWIANPGVYGDFSGVILTGSTGTSMISSPKLKITEVFFEGWREWIEITNIGDESFSGSISLIGAANNAVTLPSVFIASGQSVVFADDPTDIIDQSIVLVSGLTLVLPDDGALNITLTRSGITLDSFDVEESLVSPYVNRSNSFEKVRYQSDLVITPSTGSRSFNVVSGIVANPGKLFAVTDSLVILDEQQSQSGLVQCMNSSNVIQITEIHHADGTLPAYIEIKAMQTISGILVSGGTQPISLPQTLRSGNTYIISATSEGFVGSDNILISSAFGLSSGNSNWTLVGQNGQVFDSVLSSVSTSGFSVGLSSSDDCRRTFQRTVSPSPGFDERFLNYLNIQMVEKVVTVGGSSCNSVSPSPSSTSTGITHSGVAMMIQSIDYDPPGADTDRESISLLVISGTLPLTGLSLKRGTTTKRIQEPVVSTQQTIVGNFTFPNSKQTCVDLIYQKAILDTFCYTPQSSSSTPKTENTPSSNPKTQTPDPILEELPDIDILHINYDPEGNDKDRETITLLLNSPHSVDTSKLRMRRGNVSRKIQGSLTAGIESVFTGSFGFPNKGACIDLVRDKELLNTFCYEPESGETTPLSLQENTGDVSSGVIDNLIVPEISILSVLPNPDGVDKGKEKLTLYLTSPDEFDLSLLDLQINKKKTRLSGMIEADSPQTLVGSFGLPNKATCISLVLRSNGQTIDTFCYTIAKQGMIVTTSSVTFEQTSTQDLSVLSQVRFVNDGKQICLSYKEEKRACRRLPPRIVRLPRTDELKLYQSYVSLLHQTFNDRWNTFFLNSEFNNYRKLFTQAQDLLDQGIGKLTILDTPVAITDIKQQAELFELQNSFLGQRSITLKEYIDELMPEMKIYLSKNNKKVKESD